MNTPLILLLLAISLFPIDCDARCRGCDLALASYYVAAGQNLTEIAALFGIQFNEIDSSIIAYNRGITSKDSIHANSRIDVPFQCNCIDGEFLGHSFRYTTKLGDTYARIAADVYHDLTTVEILSRTNAYDVTGIPSGADINATVKCFCGDAGISRDYGLFVTYPLRRGDTLESVAADVGFSDHKLLQRYNPNVDFDSGGGLVFVPRNGAFFGWNTIRVIILFLGYLFLFPRFLGAFFGWNTIRVIILFFLWTTYSLNVTQENCRNAYRLLWERVL